jgi:hypothetical protein
LRFQGVEPVPKYFIGRKNRSLLGACYVVRLDMSLNDVLSAFDRHRGLSGRKSELSELVAVQRDREAIERFLADYPNHVDYLKLVLQSECEATLDDLNFKSTVAGFPD